MRWILFLFSGLAFIDGFLNLSTATTIFQQIVGYVAFILSGVLFAGAAIVDAIVTLKVEMRKMNSTAP